MTDTEPNTLENPPLERIPKKKAKHSVATWLAKAKRGDLNARFMLGKCYEEGIGTGQNMAEAIRWYTKAAESGHPDAQCALGRCYSAGKGLRQWHVEAVYWFTKAAENGNAEAQCALGLCHAFGRGTPDDDEKARQWLEKSSSQGFETASMVLERLFNAGQPVVGGGRYLVDIARQNGLHFVYDRVMGGFFWLLDPNAAGVSTFLTACQTAGIELVLVEGGSVDTTYQTAFRTVEPIQP